MTELSVAIVLSTFNGELYLPKLLDSLEKQDFHNLSIYIRDDLSSDSTPSIIREFQFNSRHSVYILNSSINIGASKSFFRILSSVQHDFIFLCDQDDIWLPTKVSTFLNKYCSINSFDQPCLIHSAYHIFGHTTKFERVVNKYSSQTLVYENNIPGFSLGMNKALLDYVLLNFNDRFCDYFLHDWLILLASAQSRALVFTIDTPLVYYRQHSFNLVGISCRKTLSFNSFISFIHSSRKLFDSLQLCFPDLLFSESFCVYFFKRLAFKLGVPSFFLGLNFDFL